MISYKEIQKRIKETKIKVEEVEELNQKAHDKFEEFIEAYGNSSITKAELIKDMTKIINDLTIKVEDLQETIEEYNNLIDRGNIPLN